MKPLYFRSCGWMRDEYLHQRAFPRRAHDTPNEGNFCAPNMHVDLLIWFEQQMDQAVSVNVQLHVLPRFPDRRTDSSAGDGPVVTPQRRATRQVSKRHP